MNEADRAVKARLVQAEHDSAQRAVDAAEAERLAKEDLADELTVAAEEALARLEAAGYPGGRMLPLEVVRRGLLRPRVDQEERAVWLAHEWTTSHAGRDGYDTVTHQLWLCSTGMLAMSHKNSVPLQPVTVAAFARTTEVSVTRAAVARLDSLALAESASDSSA